MRLHGAHGLALLVGERENPQIAGRAQVKQARDIQPFAAADRGHQPQHGRRCDAGNRRAERQAEPADRLGQRRANRHQVGRSFECEHRALERHHHPEEGAQHSEHDQQADEIRRDCRARQAAAPGLDTLPDGISQGGRYGLEQSRKRRQRLRPVRRRSVQRGAQCRALGTVLPQFMCAHQIGAGERVLRQPFQRQKRRQPRHGGHQLRWPVGRQVGVEPLQRREQVVRLQRRKQVQRRQPFGRIVQVGLVEVRVVVQVGRRLGLREPLPLVADKERRRELTYPAAGIPGPFPHAGEGPRCSS